MVKLSQILDDPDAVKQLLSTDDINEFADNLKSCIKFYARGIDINGDYIDEAIDRVIPIVQDEENWEAVSQSSISGLVLAFGFWAKWAPDDYDFDKLSDCINSSVDCENPIIKATALTSLGFLWQRRPEYADDWSSFTEGFFFDNSLIRLNSLFGFYSAIQNQLITPPAEVVDLIIELMDDGDADVRQETATIIEQLSSTCPDLLIPHIGRIDFAVRNDINNSVVFRLRNAVNNLKKRKEKND